MNRATLLVSVTVVAVVVVGGGCTDLTVDGDVQLSCSSNDDCPVGLSCAQALQRCVAEDVVAEAPIAVAVDAVVDNDVVSRVEGFAVVAVTTTFSKPPTGDVVALVDNRLEIACESDDAGAEVVRCAFDARDFPAEADGGYDIVVVAKDGAGNEARSRARFAIDTTAPAVAPDSTSVTYVSGSDFVRDVTALGDATDAVVQLSVTEIGAAPPALVLVDGANEVALLRDANRSAGLLQVFTLDGANTVAAQGQHALRLRAVDDVGNAADVDIGAVIVVDRVAPDAPVVDVAGRVVFDRVPWGTRANPQARFTVTGLADAAEPLSTVLVTSADALSSSLLGSEVVDANGAFVAELQVVDVPRVFVRAVDGAGNVGPAARVHDVVWTASLGGRLRDDDFSNPHTLFNLNEFDERGLIDDLRGEPVRAGDLVDGAGFVVDAIARRTALRTVASGQPSRMAGFMGFLPKEKAAVLFGGIAQRNGGQLTDTFVQRSGVWVAVLGDNPPDIGPLAYDTTDEQLVTLLVTGETWAFDGVRWTELPVAPPSTTGGGPIAWDPLLERLVALQGTETWVLADDDVWRQLDGAAPIAGVRPIPGGDDTPLQGGVIAFDGVDGDVLLYGNEAGGGGAVYALVDDVWVRRGSAPAMMSTTAVEDANSGRVHFVCRALPQLVGEMLTWDGTAMITGPADPDPRSGCSAAYDTALDRIVVHGGTNEIINVQSLPQRASAVLADGAAAWVDVPSTAPALLQHNAANGQGVQTGVWHFNHALQRTVLRGAYTGALTSRTTNLWDGEAATLQGGVSQGPPFFDGINSRFVQSVTRDQILSGGAWVSRDISVPVPAIEGNFDYDESEDSGFGFSGFDNNGLSDATFFVRGSTVRVLNPPTRPPARQQAALRDDVANDRMILAGGFGSSFNALNDAWAYETADEDWHQLDDLPLGASGAEAQLLFDRARGVMMGVFKGHLFDLRGSSWVEVNVDVRPRDDALAVYDENAGHLLFVGGLDFERLVTTLFTYDIAGARAAQVARFDVTAAGAADDAVFEDAKVDVSAGASGADDAGVKHGVDVLLWGASSFVPLASNTASAQAPTSLSVTKTRAELGPALRDTLILALRSPPTGPGLVPARLKSEQIEITLRYSEP